MQPKFVQVTVCRSDDSPQDKRLSQGLASRLKLLMQQGIGVGGSGLIMPGESVLGEMVHGLLSSRIAILLMSTDWLLDPIMQAIAPLLLEQSNSGDLHLLPILLRPFPPALSPFAHIAPVNYKLVVDMTRAEREKTWEAVLSQVLEILGIQLASPSLHSMLTEQYLRDLSTLLTKNTRLRVSLLTASVGNGTYISHGLGTKPDRVLATGRDGQEVSIDQIGSTMICVTTKGCAFTGLAIVRKGE